MTCEGINKKLFFTFARAAHSSVAHCWMGAAKKKEERFFNTSATSTVDCVWSDNFTISSHSLVDGWKREIWNFTRPTKNLVKKVRIVRFRGYRQTSMQILHGLDEFSTNSKCLHKKFIFNSLPSWPFGVVRPFFCVHAMLSCHRSNLTSANPPQINST